ncbi:MAG: outer membrane lipid asymmetry maintenance protein MlaD [Candidatus Brocadiia bacterium]
MKKFYIELTVGVFMILGILCLGYLSVRLGQVQVMGGDDYPVYAVFSEVGGLREGAPVVIAGVTVGHVDGIELADYAAKVELRVRRDIELQEDSIASVKTRGLIGEKYVAISPGGSRETIEAGGRIRETQPAVDLETLISKYAFGEV